MHTHTVIHVYTEMQHLGKNPDQARHLVLFCLAHCVSSADQLPSALGTFFSSATEQLRPKGKADATTFENGS